jgi:hypothetical protein
MKKVKVILIALPLLLSSCATLLGGKKTDHQRNKPACDEPRRRVRIGFLIADAILFPPGLIIDFCTKKIYQPGPNPNKVKKCKGGKDA